MVETPTFLKGVKRSGLSEEEHRRSSIICPRIPRRACFSKKPEGVRKVRFAGDGQGKSGAYRVVYFYHDDDIPLFALVLFAKNEKANLTPAE
jgi:mRNA-degrading endonuclease RelE of RelBE toxin-antitoxin system